ncbi:unnamed protein product [Nesidiocoris tenuis]|uniref:Piwi domain-containing protein n=1 Tax=Nesidiocoris tenuis TaxID=355587 RepID=A0A6H5H6Z6_9HEMI|nr:unnamed protein product [Nesidiocoris tenuis]
MSGMSRGGGRGDAVRRLLESRRSDSQEKTAVGEEPQPSTASTSDLPMPGGRGMFLSRLASGISRGLLPRSSPAPSYHTEPTPGPTVSAPVSKPATAPPLQATPPSQPAQPLMGMGRAKLLSMVSRLEVWPGFVTAIQNFEGGVMLCCDASYRVLRTQTVYELIWGITLAATNEVLPARTIDLEKIFFGRGTESAGTIKCDWTRGATNNPVLSAVNFDRWVMICTERDRKIAEEFIRVCQQKGPRMGLQVANPRLVTIQNDDTQKYLQQLMQLRKENVDIVVILLPLQRADKYAAVKKYCCIDSPVPSQKNTMVIGIDTYHDAKQRGSSVGAIVASLNAPLTRWFSRIYSQDAGQELIDGLVMAFVACLHKYKETNGNFPDQVIIYRDGVGDGQLSICKDYEVQQLVRAASCDVPGYEPKFLFVVCQKQINTRFFAKAGRDFVNPSPGTVMDHTITRRELFDFFLVSQSVNQRSNWDFRAQEVRVIELMLRPAAQNGSRSEAGERGERNGDAELRGCEREGRLRKETARMPQNGAL